MATITVALPRQLAEELEEEARGLGMAFPDYVRSLLVREVERPGEPRAVAHLDGGPRSATESGIRSEPEAERKPIWMKAIEAGETIPVEERARLPRDGARNVDHYVYGVPRQE